MTSGENKSFLLLLLATTCSMLPGYNSSNDNNNYNSYINSSNKFNLISLLMLLDSI